MAADLKEFKLFFCRVDREVLLLLLHALRCMQD
jgi:hypothetical protein